MRRDTQVLLVMAVLASGCRAASAEELQGLPSEIAARSYDEGVELHKKHDLSGARAALLRAVKLAPKNDAYLRRLGRCAFELGLYGEAIKAFDQAGARIAAMEVYDFYAFGMSYAAVGDYHHAYISFDNGRIVYPGSDGLREWGVVVSYGAGGWVLAKVAWRQTHPDPKDGVERSIDNYDLYDRIETGLQKIADRAERKGLLYAALTQHSLLYRLIGDAALRGSFDRITDGERKARWKRLQELKNVIAAYKKLPLKPSLPTEARRHAHAGQDYADQGRWREAARSYVEALEIAPWWPEGHFNLAFILAAEDPPSHPLNANDAVQEMKTYLELVPEGVQAKKAKYKIKDWGGDPTAAFEYQAEFVNDLNRSSNIREVDPNEQP